jgi:acyl carrier protein
MENIENMEIIEKEKNEIFEKVSSLAAEILNQDKSKITMETKFIADLGAESLDIITLMMEFEDKFNKTIPDQIAKDFITIGDVVRYIHSQPGQQNNQK